MGWHPDSDRIAQDVADAVRAEGSGDATLSVSSDDRVFAWSLYGGYALSPNLALEAGYLGAGKVKLDYHGSMTH